MFQVLARRALLRYLFWEIESAHSGRSSIFVPVSDSSLENAGFLSMKNAADSTKKCSKLSKIPIDSSKEQADENLAKLPKKSRPLLKLQSGVNFHLFCSHTPCGDASIFLKDCRGNGNKQCVKRSAADDNEEVGPYLKKHKVEGDNDVYRTGAKCLNEETKRDLHLPGTAYHVVGAVRTKPGRGDRTLSVSCSDKLLRWHSCGIQVIG